MNDKVASGLYCVSCVHAVSFQYQVVARVRDK